jgi:hypothetical protein
MIKKGKEKKNKTQLILDYLEENKDYMFTAVEIAVNVFKSIKEAPKVRSILQGLELRERVNHSRPYWGYKSE